MALEFMGELENGEVRVVLLAGTGSPDGAEGAQAAAVLADGEEAPRRLPSGQDPAHLMQCLLPEIVGLQLEQHT